MEAESSNLFTEVPNMGPLRIQNCYEEQEL